jgi:hypothetical protein
MFFLLILVVVFSLKIDWGRILTACVNRLRSIFLPKYYIGQKLYNGLILHQSVPQKLDSYKFYDSLVYEIDECSRRFGTPRNGPLLTVKKALVKDLEYDKKIYKIFSSALLTFLAAALITWMFSTYANQALRTKMSYSYILMALSWQIIGVSSFALILSRLRDRLMNRFGGLFQSFYMISLFSEVGMPIETLLSSSKVDTLYSAKLKGLDALKERLKSLVHAQQSHGLPIKEELTQLIDELWLLYGEYCQKLEKQVLLLKFIWLCVFFFSLYLASIFNIIGSFGL